MLLKSLLPQNGTAFTHYVEVSRESVAEIDHGSLSLSLPLLLKHVGSIIKTLTLLLLQQLVVVVLSNAERERERETERPAMQSWYTHAAPSSEPYIHALSLSLSLSLLLSV